MVEKLRQVRFGRWLGVGLSERKRGQKENVKFKRFSQCFFFNPCFGVFFFFIF